jgi:multidrug efflux pump subunit AcrB
MDFMWAALVIATLLIYTVLAVQFNSFLQPFVLLAAIPFGFVGVILALVAHDKPVSIMAMMGMVGLGGVVVNDAIVLVSFVNGARREGASVHDALLTAGRKRLRPILLTSVTTVAGLMPVIYGWGGYEPFIAPAAIVLAYGLLFATVLTLVLVPCTYYVAYDLKRFVFRR